MHESHTHTHTHTHTHICKHGNQIKSLCYDLLYLISSFFSIAILSGKKPPAYLIYTTGRGTYPSAGGLADRLKGITTVFFLAVLLGTITITLIVLLGTITMTLTVLLDTISIRVYYYIVIMV